MGRAAVASLQRPWRWTITVILVLTSVATAQAAERDALEVIRHPRTLGVTLPPAETTVGIVAVGTETGHCALRASESDALAPGCGETIEPEISVTDIGTHLSSIIAAKRGGVAGVNPDARILGVRFDEHENTASIAARIRAAASQAPVILLGLRIRTDGPRDDPVTRAVQESPRTLFVVPAGNDGADVSRFCPLTPLCLRFGNVLAVTALTNNNPPQLWREQTSVGSNFGRQLGLGAPGEAVLGSVGTHQTGLLSGTDVAAAYVAGAASLLFGTTPRLTPLQAKNRLIYTSDLFDTVAETSQGGRLNIERAMAKDDDIVVLNTGAVVLRGVVDKSATITYSRVGASSQTVQLYDVARLVRHASTGLYTLFTSMSLSGEVRKITGVTIESDVVLTMRLREADRFRFVPISFKKIEDFTIALEAFAFPGAPGKRVWRSERATPEDVGRDLTFLYQRGVAIGAIDTVRVTDSVGRGIEQFMRQNGLFPGGMWPREFDEWLCSLNVDSCVVDSVSGPRWAARPGAVFSIPWLMLRRYAVPQPVVKASGVSMETLAVNVQMGCAVFDLMCSTYTENINAKGRVVLEDAFSGRVNVPTIALAAEIDERLAEVFEAERPANIIPRSTLRFQALPPDAAPAKDQQYFWAIRHPLTMNATLPSNQDVGVVLYDLWVDAGHCALQDARIQVHNVNTFPDATRVPCGTRSDAVKNRDHGTHVAGIIGARYTGTGLLGINPEARIETHELDLNGWQNDSGYVARVARQIDDMFRRTDPKPPRVFNMSWKYTYQSAGDDPIATIIGKYEDRAAFVIAAGNDATDKSHLCDVRPACLDYNNVISVVAVDQSQIPQKWQISDKEGTNFGPKFTVTAPGDRILSSLRDNGFGQLSGTSQAAPIVAGVVSLMFAERPELIPVDVKRRLIYSSDLYLAGAAFGGLVDAERALDSKLDFVRLKRRGEYRGILADSANTELWYYVTNKMGTRSAKLQDVFRISSMSQSATLVIRTPDGVEDRLGIQQPIRNVILLPERSTMIRMILPSGEVLPFSVEDILELVARTP